jgi:1-acyl-sn-glycerol-3-phosphate acyltransferase
MLALRSFLFNAAFYLNLLVWMLVCIPSFFVPRKAFMRVARAWGRSSLWLQKAIAGTSVEFRGLDRLPPGGLLIAAKHQSMWETFALVTVLDDAAFVLKRELMWIPFFGWYQAKARMVPIDRRAGSAALTLMNRRAREEAAQGRQIIIFPEGTRRAPGAEPAYKFGVAHLYGTLGVPCVPVALNSGLFWPRRSFLRRPGTIVVEFLDPIPPGLPRDEFFARLKRDLEAATDRLVAEGLRQLGDSAPPSSAAARHGHGE